MAAETAANALARPEQFREVLNGLETYRPGMGRHAAAILRDAKGHGNKSVLAALHAAGARAPKGRPLTYGPDGQRRHLRQRRLQDQLSAERLGRRNLVDGLHGG